MTQDANLARAISLADLPAIVRDLYPDSNAMPGSSHRAKATWRGGDGESVAFYRKQDGWLAVDYAQDHTYNAWTFLTDVAGFTKQQAAKELLYRAGLSDDRPKQYQAAKRHAKQAAKQAQDRETYLKAKLERATTWHKSGKQSHAASESEYLQRKQVLAALRTHCIRGYNDAPASKGLMIRTEKAPDALDGVRFGQDDKGKFVQILTQDVQGNHCGFQRIYDAKVLKGERDKDFIGGTKGAFVLIAPKQAKRDSLATLARNHDIAVCEGVATGLTVAMAKPKAVIVCALSAGNLAPVIASIRDAVGYRSQGQPRKITIYADNDSWTKGNPGLTKAHKAALEYHCYVRSPSWTHRTLNGAKPTDFNDLHVLFGLASVKRTRIDNPSPRLAFASELAKLDVSKDKYVPAFDLPTPGQALTVKAPMETGKTHALAHAVKAAKGLGLTVLVVVHRESLADALAGRLGLENYNDYKALDLAYVNGGLVICFDSLHKLKLTGRLPDYDLIVFDECEQVTRHTTEAHIKNKAANFAVLGELLKATPRVIGLDAHAGMAWLELLRRFAPDKQVTWHKHHHMVGQGRTVRLVFDKDDALDAYEQSTVPTWTATDSLKLTRDMAAYYGEDGVLTISSETTGTEAVQSYFNDPSGQARQYQRLNTTPSAQTGLSDDSQHWQHVIGMFCNLNGQPQDRAQALMRARGVKDLTVWTDFRRRPVTRQGDLLKQYAAADKAEAELTGTGDAFGTYDSDYLALKALVRERASLQNARPKYQLAKELTLLGFDVHVELPEAVSDAKAQARKQRRDALKEAGLDKYVRERVQARRLSDSEALRLQDAHRVSRDDMLALQQWQVRDFYRLPEDVSDDTLAQVLRDDDYGRLRKQVTNYEAMLKPEAVAKQHALDHRESDSPLQGDARTHMLLHEFGQKLAGLVGLTEDAEDAAMQWGVRYEAVLEQYRDVQARHDATEAPRPKGELARELDKLQAKLSKLQRETLDHTYNAEAAKDFARYVIARYDALARVFGEMPSLEQLRGGYLLAHVGTWLRDAGLTQAGQGRKDRAYALTLSSIYGMSKTSRPRRDKWQIAQNVVYKKPYRELCENSQKARPRRDVLDVTKNTDRLQVPVTPEDAQDDWQVLLHTLLTKGAKGEIDLQPHTRDKLNDARCAALAGDAVMLQALEAYLSQPEVRMLL